MSAHFFPSMQVNIMPVVKPYLNKPLKRLLLLT